MCRSTIAPDSAVASRDPNPHPATHCITRKAHGGRERGDGDVRQQVALLTDRMEVLERRDVDIRELLGNLVEWIGKVQSHLNHLDPLVAQRDHYLNDLETKIDAKKAELAEACREPPATDHARIQEMLSEVREQLHNLKSIEGFQHRKNSKV